MGALVLVLSMIVHGAGMYFVMVRAARHGTRGEAAQRFPERHLFFGALILAMLATHIAELLLWAAVFTGIGAISSIRDAFYFAAVTYTTLGYEDVALAREWRLLAPLCAMTGVFAAGWTTGVMITILGRHFAPPGFPGAPPPGAPGGQDGP